MYRLHTSLHANISSVEIPWHLKHGEVGRVPVSIDSTVSNKPCFLGDCEASRSEGDWVWIRFLSVVRHCRDIRVAAPGDSTRVRT